MLTSLAEFVKRVGIEVRFKSLPGQGVYATFGTGLGGHTQRLHVLVPDERVGVFELLRMLALSARAVDASRGFWAWCELTGVDPQTRVSRKLYKRAVKQRRGLWYLLGPLNYRLLLTGCDLNDERH